MVLAEEMKHAEFKRRAKTMNNFKNVPMSLSKTHQITAYSSLISGKLAHNSFKGKDTDEIRLETVEGGELLRPFLDQNTGLVTVMRQLKVRGQLYVGGNLSYVPIRTNERNEPVFGRLIVAIQRKTFGQLCR